MFDSDRTTEALLARLALAEKATKGDWYIFRLTHPSDHFNVRASFSAANVEQICRCNAPTDANQANAAHIDEILRLRAEVEFWRQETQDVRENFERTLQCERDKTDRLEREADWLAENCWKKPEAEYHPLREMRGGFFCDACPHDYDCRKCWREAARKAVEANHD